VDMEPPGLSPHRSRVQIRREIDDVC